MMHFGDRCRYCSDMKIALAGPSSKVVTRGQTVVVYLPSSCLQAKISPFCLARSEVVADRLEAR